MKRISTLICAIIVAASTFSPTYATDYTVEPNQAIKSNTLPLFLNSATIKGSLTQQIFLAEELLDDDDNAATAGDITALTFYYAVKDGKTSAPALTRSIEIWLMQIDNSIDAYTYDNTSAYEGGKLYKAKFLYGTGNKAGTKVFDGDLKTKDIGIADGKKSVKLDISAFSWDGTSNIVMTVLDKSTDAIGTEVYDNLRFYITETTPGRFVHWRWLNASTDDRSDWIADLNRYGDTYSSSTPTTKEAQANSHKYVALTTFTIVSPIPAPENLTASSVTTSSARLSWDAVTGATAYNVRWGTTSGSLSESEEGVTNAYLDIDELEDGTTYYFDVQAVTADGTSAFASEVSFETVGITHEHNGISFDKWSSTNSLPTAAGNYYLSDNVSLTSDWNVNANINLCLNGHSVCTETHSIQIKDGSTLALYDNVGTGSVYGYFVAAYPKYGLINIETGGTLVLSEGKIQNLYGSYEEEDDPDDKSLSNAIYNNGTLKLSGAPVLNSYNADLYLGIGKVITIESEKPLTNTVPFSVYKSGAGAVTSGWANMNGADPRDYLVSANNSLFLTMGASEAEMKNIISLSETSDNTAIETYFNQLINVRFTRSLTSAQYNTFCLPFALTSEQMQEVFGEGYDLEELTSSSLNGDLLNMIFTPCTDLAAGKPYLLQPSVNVENPTFEGVTITETEALSSETDYVDFKAIYSPTLLTDGDESLLFLGADNTLFSPAGSTGPMKGFRGYFETKNGVKANAIRAHITKKTGSTTGIGDLKTDGQQRTKVLRNGQLLIIRGENTYNAQGQLIK